MEKNSLRAFHTSIIISSSLFQQRPCPVAIELPALGQWNRLNPTRSIPGGINECAIHAGTRVGRAIYKFVVADVGGSIGACEERHGDVSKFQVSRVHRHSPCGALRPLLSAL